MPPTPTPSPSEPSPLQQAGGVPFSGAGPRAHRLFDDDLEPETFQQRAAYSGPTAVPSNIPEPAILKEVQFSPCDHMLLNMQRETCSFLAAFSD